MTFSSLTAQKWRGHTSVQTPAVATVANNDESSILGQLTEISQNTQAPTQPTQTPDINTITYGLVLVLLFGIVCNHLKMKT